MNGSRGGNPRSIAPYRRWVKAAGHATQWRETLSPQARLGETWWLGLRLSAGIDPAEALATSGLQDSPEGHEAVIRSLLDTGHLERDQERLRLTPLGLPLADAVASKFLGAAEDGA